MNIYKKIILISTLLSTAGVTHANCLKDVKAYAGFGFNFSILSKNENIRFFSGQDRELANGANLIANNSFKSSLNKGLGANLFFGLKFNDFFGVEFGYSRLIKKPKFNITGEAIAGDDETYLNINSKVTQSNIYTDLLGYYPVSDKLDLIASLGVARLSVTTKYKSNNNIYINNYCAGTLNKSKIGSTNKIQPRVGLGAAYALNKDFSIRCMVRYQSPSIFANKNHTKAKKDFYKSVTYFGVDVIYFFN